MSSEIKTMFVVKSSGTPHAKQGGNDCRALRSIQPSVKLQVLFSAPFNLSLEASSRPCNLFKLAARRLLIVHLPAFLLSFHSLFATILFTLTLL